MYPNPVKDQLFVDFQGSANWQIFDIHELNMMKAFSRTYLDIDIDFKTGHIYPTNSERARVLLYKDCGSEK